MTRILLRSAKDPFQVLSPELALALYPRGVFGRNVGNLVFTDAVHRLLSVPGTEVVPNSYLTERRGMKRADIDRINEEYDQFVVPLANAFRPKFLDNLRRLTRVIEGLRIPVVVVGVGVAGGIGTLENPLPTDDPRVEAAASRFVRAVLDRSATIGVRGEFTREFLALLGFGDEHVEVVGCPSLFRNGPGLTITKDDAPLTPDSRFTINISPYVRVMGQICERHAAKYPHMIYIPQGDDSLEMMLWGTEPEPQKDRRIPSTTDHVLYRENRMRFFVDTTTWMDFLSQQQFSFGTRIHGNIVALSAQTPAHVLAHDSRTLELARYHEIPHTLVSELPRNVDAADLYQASDYTAFNKGHAGRFEAFAGFLQRNGLEHVYEEGKANPGYAERLAATPLSPPVETPYTSNPAAREQVARRMAHLYGLGGQKLLRAAHAPKRPFTPAEPRPFTVRLKAAAAEFGRDRKPVPPLSTPPATED